MSRSPTVSIRADAGHNIGTGHVVRCLSLADALRHRGATVEVVSRSLSEEVQDRIERAGYALRTLPEVQTEDFHGRWTAEQQVHDARLVLEGLPDGGVDVMVVDHYALGRPWEEAARPSVQSIVVIDDLADRPHECDILVDQGWYGPNSASRYERLVPKKAKLLLGPRYALLESRYAALHKRGLGEIDRDRTSMQCLVSFGGSDPTNETAKVLEALALIDRTDLHAHVALTDVGRYATELAQAQESRTNVSVYEKPPSLAALLAISDFAIGAGGTTTWERACLGVPSLVTTTAENQRELAGALDGAGLVSWIGGARDTSARLYAEQIERVLANGLPAPPPLVDGWGAARVALSLLHDGDLTLSLRHADPQDAAVFMGADLRSVSTEPRFLDGSQVWAAQIDRFNDALSDPIVEALVVDVDDIAVGGAYLNRSAVGQDRVWLDDAVGGWPHLTPAVNRLLANARDQESLTSITYPLQPPR